MPYKGNKIVSYLKTKEEIDAFENTMFQIAKKICFIALGKLNNRSIRKWRTKKVKELG